MTDARENGGLKTAATLELGLPSHVAKFPASIIDTSCSWDECAAANAFGGFWTPAFTGVTSGGV